MGYKHQTITDNSFIQTNVQTRWFCLYETTFCVYPMEIVWST